MCLCVTETYKDHPYNTHCFRSAKPDLLQAYWFQCFVSCEYYSKMSSVLQFPSECKNVKIFQNQNTKKSSGFNNKSTGKFRDGKKRKDVGDPRIQISSSFNCSTETFELFGGSYGIH